jgi:hypothetical protein
MFNVVSKPERHFPIRDAVAFLGQAGLAQPFLFSRCKLPVRASNQRRNKGGSARLSYYSHSEISLV